MSFSAKDLLDDQRPKPISITQDKSLQDALELMFKHGYSQLPVVTETNLPLGIVTGESILRAAHSMNVPISGLKVSSALAKAKTHTFDGDLFMLLNDLQESSVVLITNSAGQLEEIVTSYDATQYLRERAEDMMRVESIEEAVKEHIESAFTDTSSFLDKEALAAVIQSVTDDQQDLRRRFKGALRKYLELQGATKPNTDPMSEQEAFSILDDKAPKKKFEDLSLFDYTQLLLHKSRTDYFKRVFDIESSALRNMLEGVRNTRNDLAHFKGEITATQQEQLRFCADWFNRHPASIAIESPQIIVRADAVREPSASYSVSKVIEGETPVSPADETIGPDDSRYTRLALWLREKPADENKIELTFTDIEKIVEAKLPDSARQYRAWWANDSVSHIQSQQWLEAGWRIAQTNLPLGRVVFTRIEGRQGAYISFFSSLINELQKQKAFPLKQYSPKGQSWHIVGSLPDGGPHLASFVYSFALRNRFRIELYINTRTKAQNKQVFHRLLDEQREIESALGTDLSWEELPDKQASRIAIYHAGSVTDSDERLNTLRKWAVETMIGFYKAIAQEANAALLASEEAL